MKCPRAALVFVAIGVGCGTAERMSSRASPSLAASVVSERGETLIAPAPHGMSIDDLGRAFDHDFVRLQGEGGKSLFPQADAPRRSAQHALEHQLEVIDSREKWAAHVSAWTAKAGLDMTSGRRFASYRAVQIDEVFEVDDTTTMAPVPRNAVYYPWRIYTGRSYEIIVEGSEQRFHAVARADFEVFSGDIEAFAGRYDLEWRVVGRGLSPTRPGAIFARTARQIETSYEATRDASVPILVEWRRIPGRQGHTGAVAWVQLREGCPGKRGCEPCRRWSFDRVEVQFPRRKPDGRQWDADGSPPDTVMVLTAGRDRYVSAKRERYARTWVMSSGVKVDVGDRLVLQALDSDLVADDPMFIVDAQVRGTIEAGRLDFGSGAVVAVGHCIEPDGKVR